jgi:hypothetical protein
MTRMKLVPRTQWLIQGNHARITLCLILSVAVNVLMIGCYRAYPPARPEGVPSSAVWAGGLDGGGWVTCSSDLKAYNVCAIYDEEGRTQGPSRYSLKGLDRAASPNELHYTYCTGKAIGLEGGMELAQISNEKP